MHKLYVTSKNNKITFYAYQYNKSFGEVIYKLLSEQEAYAELSAISSDLIVDSKATDEHTIVTLANEKEIVIDHVPELNQLREIIEKENLKRARNSSRRVNRTRSNKIGKRIISFSLAAAIASGILGGAIKTKNKGKILAEESNRATVTYDLPINELRKNAFSLANYTTEDKQEKSVSLDLEFEYKNGKKLETTMDYCGDIIEYYASRYGLPSNLICYQITQESPNPNSDGVIENPCQITYSQFIDQTYKVPIYDENGFTGEYDSFTITESMLNSTTGNIQVGIAYLRFCVDKYDSLITGLFAYNQGPYALSIACEYYGLNVNDYKGDEKAIEARDLVVKYYEHLKEIGKTRYTHGDPIYLENIFGYASIEDRGTTTLTYYLGEEIKTVAINNTLEYNMDLGTQSLGG